jgi:ubiquinone/menaquinone biosynthesis C-methylase UbiE
MIKKIIKRFVLRKQDRKLETSKDIIDYKSQAWRSKRMAGYYHKGVEKSFFDAVTKNIFLQGIQPGSSVLDVGAGTGRLSFAIADHGCRVVSCDISGQMLKYIEEAKGGRDIKILECPGDKIPLPDGTFDAISSMDFLLHFPNWEAMLAEQVRLCKRGGVILFNFLSEDNVDFLRRNRPADISGSVKDFFSTDFAVFSDQAGMSAAARRLGVEVESMTPYNFFSANSMFGCKLSREQVGEFTDSFNEHIRNPDVLRFVQEFEEVIVRNMTIACSVTMVVKLRKL